MKKLNDNMWLFLKEIFWLFLCLGIATLLVYKYCKGYLLYWVVFLCFLIPLKAIREYLVIYNYKFENFILKRDIKRIKTLHNVKNTFIWTDIEDEYVEKVKDLLRTVSKESVQHFERMGFSLVVADRENMGRLNKGTDEYTEGTFSMYYRVLVLYKEDIEEMTKVFYHEWGHFIDLANSSISKTYLFRKYFNKKVREKVNENYTRKRMSNFILQKRKPTFRFVEYLKVKNLGYDEYAFRCPEEFLAEHYEKYKNNKEYDNGLINFFIFFENNRFDFMQKWLKENI